MNDGTVATRYLGVPVQLYLEMQAHNDAVGRDLILALGGGKLPEYGPRLSGLVGTAWNDSSTRARRCACRSKRARRRGGPTSTSTTAYRRADVPAALGVPRHRRGSRCARRARRDLRARARRRRWLACAAGSPRRCAGRSRQGRPPTPLRGLTSAEVGLARRGAWRRRVRPVATRSLAAGGRSRCVTTRHHVPRRPARPRAGCRRDRTTTGRRWARRARRAAACGRCRGILAREGERVGQRLAPEPRDVHQAVGVDRGPAPTAAKQSSPWAHVSMRRAVASERTLMVRPPHGTRSSSARERIASTVLVRA